MRKKGDTVRAIFATKPVNPCPVDVNESSLAVVVVAVSADGGARVIATSFMSVVSARIVLKEK